MNDGVDDIHVLHVDDQPDFSELVVTYLERQDDRLAVETALSASDGLERLQQVDIDCIVSDYDMPGMNGLEFLEVIRESDPQLPFILYTGKGNEEIASEAITAGVTDYLKKSSGTEQYELLANRVTNAVQQYRNAQRVAELDRIRSVIRDVNQALVRAQSQGELEREICSTIVQAEPYELVWIGEHDEETLTVFPRASAGEGVDYLEEISITTGTEPTARGPTGQAIRTGEMAFTQSIAEDVDYEPWRELASDRGYRSSAAIPLLFDDTLYGVLNVYCSREAAFDDDERELLWELGDDIAHGLHRIDREHELRRFKEATEHAGHAVYITDAEGVIQYVNPAFERVTGYEADEAVGQTPAILNAGVMDEAYFEGLWDTIERGEVWQEEVVNRRASGERYTAHQTIAPIDAAGIEPTEYVAIQADITELKRREEELDHQRQRYRALLDAVPDPVFIADPEGPVIVDTNRAAEDLMGRPRVELIGQNPTDLHPHDDNHEGLFRDHLRRSREAELRRVTLAEFDDGSSIQVETATGERIPVEINAGFVDINGQTLFQGVFRDITDRRQNERKLERQNERLEDFASLVSHDLHNPLSVATGHLELALAEDDNPHLERAATALDRMASMIDGFLLWAREGRDVEDLEAVDIPSIADECWHNVDGEAADLVVETEVSVVADASRLQHLFENLFRNAIDHAGSPVEVRVGLLETEDGIYVEDDGPGIPDDIRDTVFEGGFSTVDGGTGLGLSIVKQIVDAHGWEIAITEGTQGGARFEILGVDVR